MMIKLLLGLLALIGITLLQIAMFFGLFMLGVWLATMVMGEGDGPMIAGFILALVAIFAIEPLLKRIGLNWLRVSQNPLMNLQF